MAKNDNLHKAKDAKNDEFYTRIEDVAEELRHYKKHFAGKVVFCNCDDPTWSAFWRYFHLNFSELGLKKLISTHYDRTEPTYKMEYEGGDDNNVEVGVKTPLEGNGDFRNAECIKLLDECDIVVTNPPFSLFREYVAVLMQHQKKFLILGNMNALTYKDYLPQVLTLDFVCYDSVQYRYINKISKSDEEKIKKEKYPFYGKSFPANVKSIKKKAVYDIETVKRIPADKRDEYCIVIEFALYKTIGNYLAADELPYYTVTTGKYADDVAMLFSLLHYFKKFKDYENYKRRNLSKHVKEFHSFSMQRLQNSLCSL